MRTSGAQLVLVLATLNCAQGFAQSAHTVTTQRAAGVMRQEIYRELRSARACLQESDLECAVATLEQVFARSDLNSYERAQAWNFRALLEYTRGDNSAAIDAYASMVAEADAPAGLVRSAHYATAQLYLSESRPDDALAALDRWWDMALPSAPDSFVLRAQIQLRRGEHAAGLSAITQALELAGEQGREPEEGWYQIAIAAHLGLGDPAAAAAVLETMLERWPSGSYYLQLADIYAELGNEERRRELYEAAYSAGWLDRATDLVTLAELRLDAGRIDRALDVLEQNRDRGFLTDGDALRTLIARARDWRRGSGIVAEERETLFRNARLEQEEARKPRNLLL